MIVPARRDVAAAGRASLTRFAAACSFRLSIYGGEI